MKMDERKQKVLQAIILDYIATADPVGSRTIAKKYNLGVSPATVRNEMADLEEIGLLEQPHASAGRIPSQAGYRYYVDCLMRKEPISNEGKEYIRAALLTRIREAETFMQVISRLLSQLTKYTALVLTPFFGKNKLRHIQMLPMEPGKAVLVLVLDNGHVEHRLVDVPEELKEGDLMAISSLLNEHLQGLSLEQWQPQVLRTIYRDLANQKKLLKHVIEQIEDFLTVEHDQKVFLGGTLNILNQPEFKQIEKVKSIFELLEEEKTLKEVMTGNRETGVVVKIGTENRHESMKDCSLITATYQLNGKVIGTLGVLGPTRMEYSKAIGIVEFLTYALTEGLRRF